MIFFTNYFPIYFEQYQPLCYYQDYAPILQFFYHYSQISRHNIHNMSEKLYDKQEQFTNYLNRQKIVDPHQYVLDLDKFRPQHSSIAQDIIKQPMKYYKIMKDYLDNMINELDPSETINSRNISIEGNLGSNFVSPRGVTSKMSNQLVGIHGIITKMDVCRSQLQKSTHWCRNTKSFQYKDYPDGFSPYEQISISKTSFIKKYDDNSNPLQFQYGISRFRDIQQVVIQQLPQTAPHGVLPQCLTAILQGNQVNMLKPGDRVQMIGIYKLISGKQTIQKGIFKSYFICLSINLMNQWNKKIKSTVPNLSYANNLGTFKIKFPDNQIFQLFGRSIAPSIYGHQELKKAILLMLLGGSEKNLDNGTHLRGDINILMVGDPGTAKSQLLRWVLNTVNIGVATTGSGSSAVGLTAAVVTDRFSGEKTLEAGAMVLADRGVVCIDQFDKMNQIDRVAIHEVMEQQTVTIAKAGIHCSLNARCSVIAAANPIYGQYIKQLPPTKNIGMSDSILSRFDLIFIIIDEKNTENDKKISERVCKNHRMAPKVKQIFNQYQQQEDYIITPINNSNTNDETTYQRSNIFKSDKKQILNQTFLKKYINFCKQNIFPILTNTSIQLISHMWSLLRQKDWNEKEQRNRVLPVTIRSDQTLIRLSTAHAKLRQSSTIQQIDCIQAFRLMVFCLYGTQNALDQEIRDIGKSLNLYFEVVNKKQEVARDQQKKDRKKEKIQFLKEIEKVEIGKEEKQTNKLIQTIIKNNKESSEQQEKSLVFKTILQLKDKSKGHLYIRFSSLVRILSNRGVPEFDIRSIVQQLQAKSMLHYEEKQDKIYV